MTMSSPKPPSYPIHGLVLLNKHQDISSHSAMHKLKRLLQAEKAGHTGSLDPLATGMLPVCLGEATKFSQFLLDADKCYRATGLLGIQTDTADSTGKVIASHAEFSVSLEELQAVLQQFTGSINQTPSMYSALKHQGRPLYAYAREGITVEVKSREIAIHDLQLLAFDGRELTIQVSCSKGTYIRNLIEDIGHALGVGAHMTALHRLYTAGFDQQPMISLAELAELSDVERQQWILPADSLVTTFPILHLDANQLQQIYQGRVIHLSPPSHQSGIYRLYSEAGQFFGLGEIEANEQLKAKRLYNSSYVNRS